ncbi:MAG: hypothetical protein IJP63_00220 [Acholeplasmatales bacterium]|nr:hypothetical protein [Acholeplasmatales bacterium]
MDECTVWRIREKYNNLIFPNLPVLIINFINDNHLNYLSLIESKYININNLLYFLRNKQFDSEYELLDWTIRYIEMKHGIFRKA